MPGYYGLTSGMTLVQYAGFIFELNSQVVNPISDEKIALTICQEFPHRPNILKFTTLDAIRTLRAQYNHGTLHPSLTAPRIPSFRYIKGVIVASTGTPLLPNRIKRKIRNQNKYWILSNAKKAKRDFKEVIEKPKKRKHPPGWRRKKPGPKPTKKKPRKISRIGRAYRLKVAHKKVSRRLKLQKKMAALLGVSPYQD